MKAYFTFKTIMSIFMLFSTVFFMLGLYHLDFALISIACLFAVASIILHFEMKEHVVNPFG